jgi:hypothetical protein
MKILVCGSRTWDELHIIGTILQGCKAFHTEEDPLILVHGDCPSGADAIADEQAKILGIERLPVPADWDTHGRAAGPIRNQKMLDENEILVTYAFRSAGKSNGTDDMIRRSKAAGIPTYVITKQ